MARYKNTDNSQGLFLAVNLKEQLQPGTFEWTLDHLIEKTDISIFEKSYKNDKNGACAYSPKILLKAIMYCYSLGIISSRRIEQACKNNIVIKALTANNEPDHDTIATFISRDSVAVKDLFAQVLLQCAELKLITGEMFAIDGCKLPSNASKEWSGSIAELKKKRDKLEKYIEKLLGLHRELDKDASVQRKLNSYKKTMGDSKERHERSVQRLEKKLKRLNEFLEKAEPRKGISGEEVKSNITDNESAFIKSPHGYIQGYNGIAIADSGNQIIVSAEAIGSGAESGSFPQMLDNLEENMKKVTGKEEPLKKSLVQGDTGFFTEDNLQEATKRKVNVLIPDQQFRQRDPHFEDRKGKTKQKFGKEDFKYDKKNNCYICPSGKILNHKGRAKLRNNEGEKYQAATGSCVNCPLKEKCIKTQKPAKNIKRTLYIADMKYKENLSDKMRKKIDEPVNRELYSRRMQIIEPVFSNITYCKGMDKFTLQTQEKVNIQWLLFCIVHNMSKCTAPLMRRIKK